MQMKSNRFNRIIRAKIPRNCLILGLAFGYETNYAIQSFELQMRH